MGDLISRSALIDWIDAGHLRHPSELCYSEMDVVNMLLHFPTVEAEPVRYGEWERFGYKWKCSNCEKRINIDGTPKENGLNFCPNCGAKLRDK